MKTNKILLKKLKIIILILILFLFNVNICDYGFLSRPVFYIKYTIINKYMHISVINYYLRGFYICNDYNLSYCSDFRYFKSDFSGKIYCFHDRKHGLFNMDCISMEFKNGFLVDKTIVFD